MLLTKIWTAVLACLATAFLAGMFLLSLGSASGFSDADKAAIRATTEAGMAALAADIRSSPVSLAPALLRDPQLKRALAIESGEEKADEIDDDDLQAAFDRVANETLLSEYPTMSVALVDPKGKITGRAGQATGSFAKLASSDNFKEAFSQKKGMSFSATIDDALHTVGISSPNASSEGYRLIAIQAVDLGASSFFRRVLGTSHPAGLIRGDALIGESIGGASPESLIALIKENLDELPEKVRARSSRSAAEKRGDLEPPDAFPAPPVSAPTVLSSRSSPSRPPARRKKTSHKRSTSLSSPSYCPRSIGRYSRACSSSASPSPSTFLTSRSRPRSDGSPPSSTTSVREAKSSSTTRPTEESWVSSPRPPPPARPLCVTNGNTRSTSMTTSKRMLPHAREVERGPTVPSATREDARLGRRPPLLPMQTPRN